MDHTSVYIETSFYVAAIAVWGFYEYRERETRHKKSLIDLRKDILPKIGSPPNWIKVGTTTATAVLLLVVTVGGVIFVGRMGIRLRNVKIVALIGDIGLAAVLVGFALLDLLLFMMAIRDSRILRKG